MNTPGAITRWVEADRALDQSAMRKELSPAVRLVSPLTDGFDFRGPDEVMAVFASAFELLTDIEIYRVTGADQDWVVYGRNRLRGRNLEEIQWLRLSNDGLIEEITLFIRPMPAAVALLGAIGPGLAKRGAMGKAGAIASRAAIPLGVITGAIERYLMPRLK